MPAFPIEASSKVAIITGTSRGLGRNTALALAGRGVDIILTYHSNKAEADAVVAGIEALGRRAAAFQLDTGDVGALDGFAENARAPLPAGAATGSTISSTMPASACPRPLQRRARRSSTR